MTYKKLKIVSSKLLLNLFFVLACLIALIPILYALSISFTKDASLLSRDFSFIPKKLTLDNYKAVFTEEPVPLWFWNSIFLAFATICLSLCTAVPASYVFSRWKFHGRKGILKILLQYNIHLVGIEGGKAGGIHDIGILPQREQLHMTGGVPSPTQLLGNLSGSQMQLWGKPVQDAAFPHAGIAGEGGELAPQKGAELLHALAGFRTGADHGKSGVLIDPLQIQRRVKVAFVDAQVHRHILLPGDGRHPVNEERFCDGIHIGGKHHQRIHIGHRRTDKAVPSGEDFLHHALVLFPGNGYQISGEGGIALPAQDAPGPAGDGAGGRPNVIKSADGPEDPSGCFLSHG